MFWVCNVLVRREVVQMAKYVLLLKSAPNGTGDVMRKVHDMGAEIVEIHPLSGYYRSMMVTEAPDDATMARVASNMGTGCMQFPHAFSWDEFANLVAILR